MVKISKEFIYDQIDAFAIPDTLLSAQPYGSGHINDTFAAVFSGGRRYIVQRVNKDVFHNPVHVMENISGVTTYLRKKIKAAGGDPDRETLTLLPTKSAKVYHVDENGDYWRCFLFVEDTITYQIAETPALFAASGEAFGKFQNLLAEYPAHTLHETIPDFHNTVSRVAQFKEAVEKNLSGRAKDVAAEIEFVLKREQFCHTLVNQLAAKELPLRVTHNDTKLNNVLIDAKSGKGVCVIDMDTVMPGLLCYDFGDSIRFGASTAAEDERDLSKVHFDLRLYKAYADAYLSVLGETMTSGERASLPIGSIMMTLECGMRFLGDHINGDVYFKVHRDGHNLDRARTQFRLVEEMEQALPQMQL